MAISNFKPGLLIVLILFIAIGLICEIYEYDLFYHIVHQDNGQNQKVDALRSSQIQEYNIMNGQIQKVNALGGTQIQKVNALGGTQIQKVDALGGTQIQKVDVLGGTQNKKEYFSNGQNQKIDALRSTQMQEYNIINSQNQKVDALRGCQIQNSYTRILLNSCATGMLRGMVMGGLMGGISGAVSYTTMIGIVEPFLVGFKDALPPGVLLIK